jgi:hypothetical protein
VDTGCGTDGECNPSGPFGSPVADGFVARLTGDLSHLEYGSYLGGSDEDLPSVITPDDAGLVHVAGYTRSADFPVSDGAFDASYNGGTSDAFISLFDTAPEDVDGLIFADGFESGDRSAWGG